MSKAREQFSKSIQDARDLLAHFDRATGGKKGPPAKDAEVLKRAGLILALTAWETYVEDRVGEYLQARTAGILGSPIADLVFSKFEEDMGRFHNPNAEKTQQLFRAYCGKPAAMPLRPGQN